jgi:exportin-2 (importin alpha re-exporter)
MLALSNNPGDKAIRAQTAESISLIAELDFPAKWPDLIDVSSGSVPFVFTVFIYLHST